MFVLSAVTSLEPHSEYWMLKWKFSRLFSFLWKKSKSFPLWYIKIRSAEAAIGLGKPIALNLWLCSLFSRPLSTHPYFNSSTFIMSDFLARGWMSVTQTDIRDAVGRFDALSLITACCSLCTSSDAGVSRLEDKQCFSSTSTPTLGVTIDYKKYVTYNLLLPFQWTMFDFEGNRGEANSMVTVKDVPTCTLQKQKQKTNEKVRIKVQPRRATESHHGPRGSRPLRVSCKCNPKLFSQYMLTIRFRYLHFIQ